MIWKQPPKFDVTRNLIDKMKEHNLNKDTILSVFNSYDKVTQIKKNLYLREKKWGKYIVGISLFWSSEKDRWVVNSCWKYKTWE